MPDKSSRQWRIIDILKWGSDYFAKKGIDSPRMNTELILTHILEISRFDLYRYFEKPLNNGELAKVKECVKRRINREPIQYILGHSYFLGRKFLVNNSTLIPRPESELLVTLPTQFIKKNNNSLKILDIGTGCGCIAISLAINYPNSIIWAIDNNEKSLELAKENSKIYDIENIIFENKDILNYLPSQSDFDLIVSNPPYISKEEYLRLEPELYFEPKNALTDEGDGLLFYRRYSEIFPILLVPEGRFFIEIGYGAVENIVSLFRKNNYMVKISKDFNNIPRVIYN